MGFINLIFAFFDTKNTSIDHKTTIFHQNQKRVT